MKSTEKVKRRLDHLLVPKIGPHLHGVLAGGYCSPLFSFKQHDLPKYSTIIARLRTHSAHLESLFLRSQQPRLSLPPPVTQSDAVGPAKRTSPPLRAPLPAAMTPATSPTSAPPERRRAAQTKRGTAKEHPETLPLAIGGLMGEKGLQTVYIMRIYSKLLSLYRSSQLIPHRQLNLYIASLF